MVRVLVGCLLLALQLQVVPHTHNPISSTNLRLMVRVLVRCLLLVLQQLVVPGDCRLNRHSLLPIRRHSHTGEDEQEVGGCFAQLDGHVLVEVAGVQNLVCVFVCVCVCVCVCVRAYVAGAGGGAMRCSLSVASSIRRMGTPWVHMYMYA